MSIQVREFIQPIQLTFQIFLALLRDNYRVVQVQCLFCRHSKPIQSSYLRRNNTLECEWQDFYLRNKTIKYATITIIMIFSYNITNFYSLLLSPTTNHTYTLNLILFIYCYLYTMLVLVFEIGRETLNSGSGKWNCLISKL